MKRILICASALAIAATQAYAGGRLDTFKFTGESNFIPGFEDVEIVGIFWDDRCTNVNYTVDDIPAIGLGGSLIPASVWAGEMQTAFDQWNNIPTSYIDMNVVGGPVTLGNGLRTFDFINELTFETPVGSGLHPRHRLRCRRTRLSSPATILTATATATCSSRRSPAAVSATTSTATATSSFRRETILRARSSTTTSSSTIASLRESSGS
jgi:hypothetical protein